MIYIKYTWQTNPNRWFIYAHMKDSKMQTEILNSYRKTNPYTIPLNLQEDKKYWKIDYLTEAEVDLIKLELL